MEIPQVSILVFGDDIVLFCDKFHTENFQTELGLLIACLVAMGLVLNHSKSCLVYM